MFRLTTGSRWLVPLVVGLALVASACGSTSSAGATVTSLTMVGSSQVGKDFDPILTPFTAQSGIKVDVQSTGLPSWDDVTQRLTNSTIAGNTPDIALVGNLDVAHFAAAGIAQPLDSLVAADRQFVDSNYEPGLLNADKVNGKQFGIPYGVSTLMMFYNKDAFAKAGLDPNKPPQTFSELRAAAQALVQSKAVKIGTNYDLNTGNWNFQNFLFSAGGSMMDSANKTITFNGTQGRDILAFWRDMVASGLAVTGNYKDNVDAFARGDIGIDIVSAGQTTNLEGAAKFPVGAAPYPVPDGGSLAAPAGGASLIVVTKDPARQAAAWKVVKAFTGPEGSTIVTKNNGYIPVSKLAVAGSQYLAPLMTSDPLRQAAVEESKHLVPWYQFPGKNASEINKDLADQITAILRGDTSPTDGLAKAASQAKDLLP